MRLSPSFYVHRCTILFGMIPNSLFGAITYKHPSLRFNVINYVVQSEIATFALPIRERMLLTLHILPIIVREGVALTYITFCLTLLLFNLVKSFDLKAALNGEEVITRYSRPALVLGYKAGIYADYPVTAVVMTSRGKLKVVELTEHGLYVQGDRSYCDLFMMEEDDEYQF